MYQIVKHPNPTPETIGCVMYEFCNKKNYITFEKYNNKFVKVIHPTYTIYDTKDTVFQEYGIKL